MAAISTLVQISKLVDDQEFRKPDYFQYNLLINTKKIMAAISTLVQISKLVDDQEFRKPDYFQYRYDVSGRAGFFSSSPYFFSGRNNYCFFNQIFIAENLSKFIR